MPFSLNPVLYFIDLSFNLVSTPDRQGIDDCLEVESTIFFFFSP